MDAIAAANSAAAETNEESKPAKVRGGHYGLIFIVLLVLVALGCGYFLYISGGIGGGK